MSVDNNQQPQSGLCTGFVILPGLVANGVHNKIFDNTSIQKLFKNKIIWKEIYNYNIINVIYAKLAYTVNCLIITCILARPSLGVAANQSSSHCCQSKMAALGNSLSQMLPLFEGWLKSNKSDKASSALGTGNNKNLFQFGLPSRTDPRSLQSYQNWTADRQTDMQHPSEQPTYMPEVPFQPLWGQEAPPPPPIVPYQELIAGFPCSDLCKLNGK